MQVNKRHASPWKNDDAFLRKIDQLPTGPDWECERIEVIGEDNDETGETGACEEVIELWKRNPVDCIQELMGNPLYQDCMRYRPERQFEDEERTNRIYDEMWHGDWWWDTQVSIQEQCDGAINSHVTLSERTPLRRHHSSRHPRIRQNPAHELQR